MLEIKTLQTRIVLEMVKKLLLFHFVKNEKSRFTKQWPRAPNSRKWRITRANVSRRVTFLSKMAFGKCGRVWRVPQMAEFWQMRVWRVFKMLLASLANLGTYIS
jgi:hypothetical protein